MTLEWIHFVSEDTWRADGMLVTYLALIEQDSAILYVMDSARPLCPVNADRAVAKLTFDREDVEGYPFSPLDVCRFMAEESEVRMAESLDALASLGIHHTDLPAPTATADVLLFRRRH